MWSKPLTSRTGLLLGSTSSPRCRLLSSYEGTNQVTRTSPEMGSILGGSLEAPGLEPVTQQRHPGVSDHDQ
ncbi:hypothetical protein TNCV_4859341 [Trichonephila clavipes]|nr:hypothetical protein TNCV_4859341 [Trichonephila clavipes]